jgi:hypothetical protein
MAKNNKLHFDNYEGDAKVKVSRKRITIKYGDKLTLFSQMVILFIVVFIVYKAFTDEKDDQFFQAAFALFILIGILYYFLRFIGFILGPYGKIFSNEKLIDVSSDLVYVNSSTQDTKEVSKIGVAAKLASLAMSGKMSEQGKRIGRNVYMGAAAIIPNTYNKTSNVIDFIHKNGLQGRLIADASTCSKIVNIVAQCDINLVKEYVTYLNDAKINPDLCCTEVTRKLKALEDELASNRELSKFGSSAETRQGALAITDNIEKRMKLLKTLYTEINTK